MGSGSSSFFSALSGLKTHLFIKFGHVPDLELCVMRLRAFVSFWFHGLCRFVERHERLYRFILFLNPNVTLSDHDVEARERLIQTFLIIFGLFLSSGDLDLQKTLMHYFTAFLWFSLFYYLMLTRRVARIGKLFYNVMAVAMACLFSSAFTACVAAFGNGTVDDLWIMYLMTAVIVAASLFV